MNFGNICAELNNDQAKNIVDSILNSGLYPNIVVDKGSFEILYQNDRAIEMYGNLIGQYCFEAYCTKETPCMDCPMVCYGDKPHVVEKHDEILGKDVKWQFSAVKWFDNKDVMLASLVDVDETAKRVNNYIGGEYESRTLDTLTRIPNYSKFYEDVEHLIKSNQDKQYAIIVFDIDKFKSINDMYGMFIGDEVLKHIGAVLKDTFGIQYKYARMHSDNFAVCLDYDKKGDIIKAVEKLRKKVNSFTGDPSFTIETSYGIYVVEDREVPVNLMCDRAMMAAKTIKDNIMKFCAFYDEQYRKDMLRVSELEREMNPALEHHDFLMYLQPKYNLSDNSLCGAEVLCRWKHPEKGIIPPNEFIPLFEKNGFILKLDEYMWEEACRTIRRWLNEGRKPVPLSINISRYHINHNDIEAVLMNLLDKYDLTTAAITLEITESLFLDKPEELNRVLNRLQKRGFKLEVDDFGSGFSSLNLIRNITVDTIKIDKDFLDSEIASEKGKIVVNHTISMAKDLHLQVIAEGVETKEHLEFLKNSKCDVAQGFFFAKPMAVEEFDKFCF